MFGIRGKWDDGDDEVARTFAEEMNQNPNVGLWANDQEAEATEKVFPGSYSVWPPSKLPVSMAPKAQLWRRVKKKEHSTCALLGQGIGCWCTSL